AEALQLIGEKEYDCIILDYMLPDMGGLDFVKDVSSARKLQMTPIIIYSARDFSNKERVQLKQYANRIILKDVQSIELLFEEAILHLHINHKDLAPEKRKVIEDLRLKEDVLAGKNILVVDDDVRNLVALVTAVEKCHINTLTAERGQEAIDLLAE